MPYLPTGYTVDPFVTWRDRVRADVDGRLGIALDYDGTPEGALVDATADALWALDQGGQSIVDGLSPVTAAPTQLDIIGEAERISRRPASRTRYTARVTLGSPGSTTVPAGTVLEYQGVRWQVVETVVVTATGDEVIIEAQDAGRVFLPSAGATLTVITPVSNLTNVYRVSGEAQQLGRDRETDEAYRIRLQRIGASGGGTAAGLLRALYAVDFVTAASTTITAPGTVQIRIVPASLTVAQQTTLAQAIYDASGSFTLYESTAPGTPVSVDATQVDGYPRTVTWYEGTEQTVDAEAVVVLETGASLTDVQPAAQAAYEALFAPLGPGGSIRWSDYYCAIADVPGVARVTTGSTDTWLSASGQQVDVSPSTSTGLLVPGTVTVTV